VSIYAGGAEHATSLGGEHDPRQQSNIVGGRPMLKYGEQEWVCVLCAYDLQGKGVSLSKIALDANEPPKKVKPAAMSQHIEVDFNTVADSPRNRFVFDALETVQMNSHADYVKGHYYATARMLTLCNPFFRASIEGWTLCPYVKGGFKAKHLHSLK
jgi:hypothetical protein